jgi:hypothetical protein
MLSARDNYCPDQVTFSGAEPSHPTTVAAYLAKEKALEGLYKALGRIYNAYKRATA